VWRDRQRERLATADQALRAVRPGDTVAVASFSNTPHTLCRALAARAGELRGVRVDHLASLFPWDPDAFALTTNYATAADRVAVNAGRVGYLPISHWHADALPPGVSPTPDVYLVPVSPPDAEGRCSFGTGAWFSPAYCRAARTVIGEVHEDFVRTGGDSWAPVERFRHLVPAEEPTGMVTTAPRTEEETAATEVICTLVAHELVHDRDTLQIGIGTVSAGLGLYLDHRHDLGVQSEAITAGVPSLVQSGVVTGRHKVLHPGVVVGSFMMGLTPEELAFVDGHPGFALYSFGATDDVTMLVRERNLTAVNNALLVDLTGQVASEGIGTQLWSGVGGQAAFAIAAAYSPGGRAIFVLPSAHRMAGGLSSRLVPMLPPGTPVTLPRGFVDYVVTEHGIATLRGKTLRQRVEELLLLLACDSSRKVRAAASESLAERQLGVQAPLRFEDPKLQTVWRVYQRERPDLSRGAQTRAYPLATRTVLDVPLGSSLGQLVQLSVQEVEHDAVELLAVHDGPPSEGGRTSSKSRQFAGFCGQLSAGHEHTPRTRRAPASGDPAHSACGS